VNAKSETGPTADPPVMVNLPAGSVLPAEVNEKPVRRAASSEEVRGQKSEVRGQTMSLISDLFSLGFLISEL
jgi:hypothetical protein